MRSILKYSICILFFFAIFKNAVAQDRTLDSLKQLLTTAKNDTIKCKILSSIIENAPDGIWEPYNNQLKKLAEKNLKTTKVNSPEYFFYKENLASAISNIGYSYVQHSELLKSLDNYLEALKIQKEIGYKYGMAITMSNLSNIFRKQGDIAKSLEWEVNSLKIKEELKDFSGMAYSLNNIGAVYKNQGLKSKAIEYYNKSLVYFELTKNKDGVANTLNNIGVFYRDLKDPEKAMKYFKRSLEINLEIHNKQGQANAYINIGKLFSTDSINIAINYFQKAVKIYQEIGDKDGLAFALNCISDSYLKNKNTQLAQKYALEALTIGNEIGYPENIRNSAKILHETYREQKNYDRALNMYELYIHMRDSLSSQETRKASIKNQLKYEYDKKAAADSVKVAEEKKLTNLQLKQEQNQRYFLYGGLGLTLIFGGIMFNRFRITKKQKLIIEVQKLIVEKQKKAVEEKQKEVLDSIRYAKRIQQSLLPSEKYFQRILKH